ncbi:MAG: hypothetical protein IPH72_19170 [Sandaracinaceae bacterium]|nr:hypothetical protein [Sandaracinaceae bacterium]
MQPERLPAQERLPAGRTRGARSGKTCWRATGLGKLGFTALHAGLRLRSGKRFHSKAQVTEFGPWQMRLWLRARDRYDAIAVRGR